MDEKINIILFDEEDLTKTLIGNYLQEVSFPFEYSSMGAFEFGLIPKNSTRKTIIIVNVNQTKTSVLDEIASLAENKNNIFILISYDKSADLQVKAMRSGAKDFLFKPLIQSDFIYSINKIYKNNVLEKVREEDSMIYSVLSVDEHVGKTYFTFNLAKELSDMSKEKVLYIDFNNNLNDIYTILNINTDYNTPFFFNKVSDDNAQSLFSRLPHYKTSDLYVMGNGVFRNSETKIQPDRIEAFFQVAQKHFKYILIDLADAEAQITLKTLECSQKIYMVTEPSLLMAEKVKTYLNKNLPKRSVRIVLNKYNAKKEEDILNQVEQKIGRQIFAKIPKNVVATSAALTRGITLKELSADLDIVKTYTKLANYMVNRDK